MINQGLPRCWNFYGHRYIFEGKCSTFLFFLVKVDHSTIFSEAFKSLEVTLDPTAQTNTQKIIIKNFKLGAKICPKLNQEDRSHF